MCKRKGFSLVELLSAVGILAILSALAVPAVGKYYESSSLVVSANNIRQLAAGSASYLADNRHTFWRYVDLAPAAGSGSMWWFGFESADSQKMPEGERFLDVNQGPLAGYLPSGIRPDPSFAVRHHSFKPKFKNGYIGVGYNVLLGGGWLGTGPLKTYWQIEKPSEVVVFATAAQVNTFQRPASPSNPMLEEFYGLDKQYSTVHFRHHGQAMVAYASGAAALVPMDESTRVQTMPDANVGRFAPRGDGRYLQ